MLESLGSDAGGWGGENGPTGCVQINEDEGEEEWSDGMAGCFNSRALAAVVRVGRRIWLLQALLG